MIQDLVFILIGIVFLWINHELVKEPPNRPHDLRIWLWLGIICIVIGLT